MGGKILHGLTKRGRRGGEKRGKVYEGIERRKTNEGKEGKKRKSR